MKRTNRSAAWFFGLVIALMMATMPIMQSSVAAASAAQSASPVASPTTGATGIEGAAKWLISQQAEDGSFLGFSGKADAGTTVDVIVALAAAKHAGVDVGSSIENAVAYLASGDVALVYTQTGVGQAAKLALGLIAAGKNPEDFANVSPVLILEHGLNADTGFYGNGPYDTALTMLAFAADGREVPAAARQVLKATQAENGGWAFDGSTDAANADSNTTAMVVQAMVASGKPHSNLVAGGVQYLKSTISDGGATYDLKADAIPDANSTALVAQGLLAAGEDATSLLQALSSFQNSDGSFFYNAATPGANVLATIQAIPAQAGIAFPIVPSATEATPVALFPVVLPLAA